MKSTEPIHSMKATFRTKYKDLSDRDIVTKIITEPYDEDAAVYLIYDRYEPLCKSICMKTLGGVNMLGDLQSELYILLKGRMCDWHALRTFGWRSTLGRWLSITAYNLSLEIRRQMIENDGKNASLDSGWQGEGEKRKTIEIPVDDEILQDRRYKILLLQEAIQRLENPDQRFVVNHRLKGYSSKEVAEMLQTHWHANGIIRFNNKKETVIPDSGYIDNLFKRGYEKVTEIYKKLNK